MWRKIKKKKIFTKTHTHRKDKNYIPIIYFVYRGYNIPQPLYNTIVGVQDNFRVSYPNRVIMRVKCIGYIAKGILNCYLGSNSDPCYIQDRVITNRVIKRFRCNPKTWTVWFYHTAMYQKDADGMANSVDPDQEQSYLGLHWLPRPDCLNT